ncbi:hypothetical protein [Escherichia phage vB_EcoM-LTH01]
MIPTIFHISRKGINIHWMDNLSDAIRYAHELSLLGQENITVTDENGIKYYNSEEEDY